MKNNSESAINQIFASVFFVTWKGPLKASLVDFEIPFVFFVNSFELEFSSRVILYGDALKMSDLLL